MIRKCYYNKQIIDQMHKALCEYSKERPHVLKNNSSNDFEKKNNNRLIF